MPTLEFKGKPFVYAHHLSVPFRELVIDEGKSLPGDHGPSLDDNLIIHGDNLEALKALLPKYAGKVDCIFIDPPYNTGNEGWCYNDNVNSPLMKQWLGKAVDGEDLERHDKWACMMWPRLKLLEELLADTGSIWVTLDDNEVASARGLLDEIFGQINFIACMAWQKRSSPDSDDAQVTATHDYVLCYAKNKNEVEWQKFIRTTDADDRYGNPDNDPRGVWTSSDLTRREYREHDYYEIELPSGRKVKPAQGRSWSVPPASFDKLKADGRLWFGENGNAMPRRKRFLSEVTDGMVPTTWWSLQVASGNADAKKEIGRIFSDEPNVFATPKPTGLLQLILSIAASGDAIVLDSFAGSGTTAHAVLAANAKDGGNRKFILIETEDYANTLTAERVRRVAKGYPFKGSKKTELMRESITWSKLQRAEALLSKVASYDNLDAHKYDRIEKMVKNGELIVTGIVDCDENAPGLGGSFTYCELGEPMDMARFFDGANPPAFDQVARYVAYTATGNTLDNVTEGADDHFIGEAGGYRLHLIYTPDAAFMRSDAAMLDMSMAETIAASAKGSTKPVLVFAAGKYMSQKALTALGITFCQLPYAIHKMLPGDGAGD